MNPLSPSRGFDLEAGHEDRARARACCAEFNARLATHAPRPPQDESLRSTKVVPHERGEE